MPSPPGWYPCEGRERYWNGTKWTNRTRGGTSHSTGQQAVGVEARAGGQYEAPGLVVTPMAGPGTVGQLGQAAGTPAVGATQYTAPPGWYPRHGRQQWWDGTQWSDAAPVRSPLQHQPPAAGGGPSTASGPLTVAPPPVVTAKQPLYYGLVSALLPGFGSCLVGRVGTGLFIAACFVFAPFALLPYTQGFIHYLARTGAVPTLVVSWLWLAPSALIWWWAVRDAYSGAKKWNRAKGFAR